MPIYFGDIEQKRIGIGSVPSTEDEFPASFPIALWGLQLQRYLDYWKQFTGQIWNEPIPNTQDDHGASVLRYPLQINYMKSICMKHSYVLFGEVPDGAWPLAPVRCKARVDDIEPDENLDDSDEMKEAKKLQNFVNRVWVQNDGRAIQQEAGLIQQFLGGTVFKLGWQPDDPELPDGIRIEQVIPDFFLPVWDSGKFNNLLEAWLIYRIPTREANIRFGFSMVEGARDPLYIEHWTKDTINITIAGKPLVYKPEGTNVEINYDNAPNPFGFVPFVYIPRERAGSYYGLSLLDDLLGLTKELNSRVADMGDVVSEVAHREVYIRNISQAPKSQDIGGTRPAINLGTSAPGVNEQPDAFAIDPPTVTEAISNYPEFLRKQLARDSSVPGVAEGEDEGSQRSALTLAFRMWPLTAKIRAVRTYWTVGLIRMAKMIIRMATIKEVGDVTDTSLNDMDWSIDWSPMIPRDKEQELTEIVQAIQTNMLSPVTGLSFLNLVDDPMSEYKNVQSHIDWLLQEQAKLAVAGGSGNSNGPPPGSVQPPKLVTKAPGQ